jgi:hypothetical protein
MKESSQEVGSIRYKNIFFCNYYHEKVNRTKVQIISSYYIKLYWHRYGIEAAEAALSNYIIQA